VITTVAEGGQKLAKMRKDTTRKSAVGGDKEAAAADLGAGERAAILSSV
jgi:hypothetical protein